MRARVRALKQPEKKTLGAEEGYRERATEQGASYHHYLPKMGEEKSERASERLQILILETLSRS